jgi:hypothetical protein
VLLHAVTSHCLQTLQHVDRNANQATLVGWWMDGLTS